ncbi:MAG: Tol-Pal system protein TolB [Holosporaceae bacterium]|jgi:TolB protein|nr:Tol-Pal system protein TolB [Holosporaceae bacterium]
MLNFYRRMLLSALLLLLYAFSDNSLVFSKVMLAGSRGTVPKYESISKNTPGVAAKFTEKSSPLVIEINRGVLKPVSIAISMSGADKVLANHISCVVKNDLQSTSFFRAVHEKAFMQELSSANIQPLYKLWNLINAQYLLSAHVNVSGSQLQIVMVLYDIISEKRLGGISIQGSIRNWRKISHIISNYIYEKITGENGYFDTKIMYVALNRARNGQKIHRIALMDQDGFGHRYLTSGATTVLTPRLSPNGRCFTFFAYREKIVNGRRVPISAGLYQGNLQTGKIFLLLQMDGMVYAPRYSPDGRFLLFCLSRKGTSSIFRLNLETKELQRLTRGICIDTSPCLSPDGQFIVFNSDRSGTQQLYVMNADGSNIRRLSYDAGYRYATPVWSPRGDWVAFSKFRNGIFYIGIVHPSGIGERVLASGYMLEGPTWSPNGRVIMYSHQDYSKREKICSVDISGNNRREIETPGDAIDPEWSANMTGLR